MSSVVTKCSPVVVCPSEPGSSPTGNIHLSSFDKVVGSSPTLALLVFDKPIVDPVETIRTALSRALVHYYPISGRLAGGGEVIACTGEGVVFVGASASCTVDEAAALLDDLYVHYPDEWCCRHSEPLLQMQVTEFSCGGFVVGVSWNHVVADGTGMGQFLQAVGELARGNAMAAAPVRSDERLLAMNARGMTAMDYETAELTRGMAFLDFTIPWSLIRAVKAQVGEPCTVFEAVVALLWQCRTRAVRRRHDYHERSSLAFQVNVRGLVGAPGGYYGNCCVMEYVEAASGEVADGDAKDVVELVRRVKHKVRDEPQPQVVAGDGQPQLGYNTLEVSSWRNIGLEAPDFGGGGPARVMWYAEQSSMPCCFLCPPTPCQGVNVMGYIVKKEHVDAFMEEIAAPARTTA